VPTYQYACVECGSELEVVQKFTDEALRECPECAGRLRKVFSAVGVVFKGSGFYRNDSRAGEGSARKTGEGDSKSGDSKSGDGKSGDGKSGDGKSSESKSSGSKSGSSSDSSSSDGKGASGGSKAPKESSTGSGSSGRSKAESAA
jgi:putative FmdB family regulatory protein